MCVSVWRHNWAPEIGIVYLHFESQISRLIFVHYTHVCANSFHFAPLKTQSSFKNMSLRYMESHCPMLNTLPCEFMLIFTYCFVLPSCCHFPYNTERETAVSQGNTVHAGLASETSACRPKCYK